MPALLATAMIAASCGSGGLAQSESSRVATASTSSAPPTTTLVVVEAPASIESLVVFGRLAGHDGFEISQRPTETDELPVTIYDDFMLSDAAEVATIEWKGIYCTPVDNAAEPLPQASAFSVRIFADDAGRPAFANVLHDLTFGAEDANETHTRTFAWFCGEGENSEWGFYDYRVDLDAPLAFEADVTYWISIQAVTPSMSTWWGWQGRNQESGASLRVFNGEESEQFVNRVLVLRRS